MLIGSAGAMIGALLMIVALALRMIELGGDRGSGENKDVH